MGDVGQSEVGFTKLDQQEGEEKTKDLECCPLSNNVSYLEKEKYEGF